MNSGALLLLFFIADSDAWGRKPTTPVTTTLAPLDKLKEAVREHGVKAGAIAAAAAVATGAIWQNLENPRELEMIATSADTISTPTVVVFGFLLGCTLSLAVLYFKYSRRASIAAKEYVKV
eukprot:gnl/MRDRNA2_/MRDRNA2_254950_c0_seq1.p1 gnl/MRDRNA2_/MRDRNA2_254950_c0~~gnl/MRDRNA2_/MRDRNA2_254950_c0_seq1.p1  ORF type:complete len:121 (-),score=31.54 gnl/MRDRNA2_/MRDRNA2_254950_c0_seq1:5-367(-)